MTNFAHVGRLALGALFFAPLAVATAQPGGNGAPAVLQQPYFEGGSYVNAHGDALVHPATYGQPCGPGCYPGGYGPGGGGAYAPFPGSEMNTEQCGPHYFDFSAEFLHLNRDAPLGESTVISTFGFANDDLTNVPDLAALTGSNIPGGDLDGFRLTGRLDVGALSFFEFSYAGLFSDEDALVIRPDLNGDVTPGIATDDNALFSIFSRFGTATNGPVGVGGSAGAPTGADFAETDAAEQHSAEYETELHTVEASLRRYWVGYSPRISGTLLIGFRYTEVQELLNFNSQNIDVGADTIFGTADDSVINSIDIGLGSDNHLAGVQIGGDVWACIVQGFRIGGEIKAGLYNNDYEIRTAVAASDGSPMSVLRQSDNHVAFLTEAKAMAVVNVTPSLSIRGGYEVLFISDLANLEDNLLVNPPYGESSAFAGVPPVDEEGDAFWDGFSFGLEYTY